MIGRSLSDAYDESFPCSSALILIHIRPCGLKDDLSLDACNDILNGLRWCHVASPFEVPFSSGFVACMFFAALSGSGPATTAAIGSITIPAMKKEGYDSGFAGGIAAAADVEAGRHRDQSDINDV